MMPLKNRLGVFVKRRAKRRAREKRTDFVQNASLVAPHVSVEVDGMVFFLPTRQKSGVDRFSKPEWKESRHLQRALQTLEQVGVPRDGSTFVDIGAHIGTTTITAVRRFGFTHALAFEPEPENYRLLQANLGVNGLETRIRCFNVAVSNRVGTAELSLPKSGLKQRVLRAGEEATSTMQVPLESLDAFAGDGRLDPAEVGMLWLDIEGHELEALQGARCLLERSVPIVMEFIPRRLKKKGRLEELAAVLSEHYTHIYDLRPRTLAKPSIRPIIDLPELARQYHRGFTDLLVFRHPDGRPGRAPRPPRATVGLPMRSRE